MVRNSQFIPIRKLWDGFNPLGVKDGVFVLFKGYIDESGSLDQNIFAWSCLIAKGKDWAEMERKWKLHLAAKNKALSRAGRPLITRYHASDCSSRQGDFHGWTRDERDDFVRGLFGIFKQVSTHAAVYDMQLDDLCDVFPEWSNDPLETAYAMCTIFLLFMVGQDFKRFRTIPRITLFHDQAGKYDPTILRAFNKQMGMDDFMYRDYFTTIAPLKWQDCIPLQPADLVAYECFKQAQAKLEERRSRKSFDALMNLKSFGIHWKSLSRDSLVELRKFLFNSEKFAV